MFTLYIVMWHGRHLYTCAEQLEPFLRAWARWDTTIHLGHLGGFPPFPGHAWAERYCRLGACARPRLYPVSIRIIRAPVIRHHQLIPQWLHWGAYAGGRLIERFRIWLP